MSSTIGDRPWRQPAAAASAALLMLLAAIGVAAPILAPGDPFAITGPALSPPGAAHWFGTDDLGRDVFSGVVHGATNSLWMAAASAALAGFLGIVVGGLAGLRGGVVDHMLTGLTTFVQALPRFFLVIVVVALFGSRSWLIAVIIGLTSWPGLARVFRAQVQSTKTREFVVAAFASGGGDTVVLRRHILPFAASVIAAQLSYQAGSAIVAEAGISFLGLGDPTVMSWGILLGSAQHFVRAGWWMSVFPGMALVVTVLACNTLSDAFAANPTPP